MSQFQRLSETHKKSDANTHTFFAYCMEVITRASAPNSSDIETIAEAVPGLYHRRQWQELRRTSTCCVIVKDEHSPPLMI